MIPKRYFCPESEARGINLAVYLKAQLQRAEQECPMVALMSRLYQATGRDSLFSFRQDISNLPQECDVTDTLIIPNANVSRMKPNTATALGLCTQTGEPEGQTHEENVYSDSSDNDTPWSVYVDRGHEDQNVDLTSVCSDAERRCEHRIWSTNGLLSRDRKADLETQLKTYGSEVAVRSKVHLTQNRSFNNQVDLETVSKTGISVKSFPVSEPLICPPKIHISQVQKNYFDMEEVQSNEGSHDGENVQGIKGTSRHLFPLKLLVRETSQQSDSSGFTEDYLVEKSIYSKVPASEIQLIRGNRLTPPGPECPTCFTVTPGLALGFNSDYSSPYDSCSDSVRKEDEVRNNQDVKEEKIVLSAAQSTQIIIKPNSQEGDGPLTHRTQHLTSLPRISNLVWPDQSHWEQHSTWNTPSLPNQASTHTTYYMPLDMSPIVPVPPIVPVTILLAGLTTNGQLAGRPMTPMVGVMVNCTLSSTHIQTVGLTQAFNPIVCHTLCYAPRHIL
ncbi:hypothetical protein DPEC_G00157750 [Dallia pectoralis]|uniref:Uncharacterized protein n=1 Tax=Dallia pectoralis TaxID=75939 RepID=A0ACC2GLB0_DALPE|nr:hypothetical protein DPEC_G00157750 [Dallia pectoralis]